MPRAKVLKTVPKVVVENVDQAEEIPTASNGVEKLTKNKSRGKQAKKEEANKPEKEVVQNGKVKGRGVKKAKAVEDVPNIEESETKKEKKTKKVVESVANGESTETKPKRGREKKVPEITQIKETVEDNVTSRVKSVRGTKKLKEVEAEVVPMPTVGKGRKRKADANVETETVPEKKETKPKAVAKTERAAKQKAEPKIEMPAATSSKSATKKETAKTKKTAKKEVEKKNEDSNMEVGENAKAVKTATRSTGRKRGAAKDEDNEEVDSKPSQVKKALLNPTETKYNKGDFDFSMDGNLSNVSNSGVERSVLKISSWNVAGLRAWLKKDGLKFLEYEEPDIFCIQEIKCTTDQMPEEVQRIPGYHPYWLCLPGGHAGVALYSKIMPINVEYGIGNAEFDDAGRLITAEYEKFYLINVYVPNSGRKLVNLEARMRWEKLFQDYIKKFDARKPVIICGDMNCSHQEIDLANPKTNTRSAGFTIEEREKLTELLSLGFVDTFRQLYPDKIGAYTYWTYMANARARNIGWRLDYFIVSERIGKRVLENAIRSKVFGSDHCPITLFINI